MCGIFDQCVRRLQFRTSEKSCSSQPCSANGCYGAPNVSLAEGMGHGFTTIFSPGFVVLLCLGKSYTTSGEYTEVSFADALGVKAQRTAEPRTLVEWAVSFPPTVGGAHISWVGWKHKSCNCNTLKRIYGTFKQRACTQHVRKMCICRRMAHADAHLAFFTLPSLLSMLQKDASVQDPLRDRACNSCAPIPRRWQAWWPWADLLPQIPKRTLEV